MGTNFSETPGTYFSPVDPPKNGTGFRGTISGHTGEETRNEDVEEARDHWVLNSSSHWSHSWSIEKELKQPLEPKLYGGIDSKTSDTDWTDTWAPDNGSKHNLSVYAPGTSRLDWKKWNSESIWEIKSLDWSKWQSDMREQEEEEEEEETAPVEDKTMANSLFLDDKPLLVGGGLANLGNTCFLNAVLQCFMHIVPLVRSVGAYNHPSPCDACNEGFCVLCALKELMDTSLTSKGSAIQPWKIVDNLSYFSSSFQRFRQEDAHEFLQCFLDRLESCCDYSKVKGEVSSEHESVVKQTFGGHLISKLQCCNCGHSSNTYEPLVDLSLEIEDVDSLSMALESFTKVERIEDPEMKFTCEKCMVRVSIEKQLLLDEAPLIATFHFKRFKNDGSLTEKIDKHVTFPLELDLLPYVERNQKVIEESKYNLFAVVVHVGLSLCSGHYYCFVHASPNAWYKFDDSKVTQVQEDFVESQEAYILFYVKQGTPWFSEFIETHQLIVDSSTSNSSPKPVLYNVDMVSNPSPRMESDRPCDVNEISNDADEASTKNFNGSKGKENLNVVSAPMRAGASCSTNNCSVEAEKAASRSVLKENNGKHNLGIAKRLCKEAADSIPHAKLRLADEVSCENQLQNNSERKQAHLLVKKNAPSSMAAVKGSQSHNDDCVKKKRRRTREVSPIRDGSLSTSRRSNNSLRLLR